ncbi:hypothetical protein PT273_00395 [Orbaceae bacterium ESL0727]|nr:hypothetical protein [Orbaceae bacterium ESL0727]
MKYISVTMNMNAMDHLNFDNCIDGDFIELELNQDSYNDLLKSNVIKKLNSKLRINIDD